MKHIVLVWELGENYGHITKLLTIGRLLLKADNKVTLVLRDLSFVYQLQVPKEITVLQAPIFFKKNSTNRAINNYSDLLLDVGYVQSTNLASMLRTWLDLLTILKPDLMIFNHSPTALIAAKLYGIKSISLGTGFEVPQAGSLFTSLKPWEKVSQDALMHSDKELLATVNAATTLLNKKNFLNLKEVFDVEKTMLCCLPELDPYLGRYKTPYWGPLYEAEVGEKPHWPQSSTKKRIFIYLQWNLKINESLLKALSFLGHSVIIHFTGGIQPKINTDINLSNISINKKPIKMSFLKDDVDLVVCHAGHGVVSHCLINGIPMLLLATQQEQKNNATRVLRLGVGLELNGLETHMKVRKKINKILTQKHFKENAAVIKNKYGDFNLDKQIELITEDCLKFLD